MKVNPVNRNSIITPKSTGYAATTALGLAVWSGVSKNKTFRKQHKPLAYITAALTAIHIGLIEYYHHKYKKCNKLHLFNCMIVTFFYSLLYNCFRVKNTRGRNVQ